MAMLNEILVGGYNRLLQKLLDMKGPAPAPQLGGDIVAGIELESDRPEWGYLRGEFRYVGGVSISANAGFNSNVQIRVVKPGVLVTIERILATVGGAAGGLDYGYSVNLAAALATAGNNRTRDSRGPADMSSSGGSLEITGKNTDVGAIGAVLVSLGLLGNTPVDMPAPVMLSQDLAGNSPGIQMRNSVANAGLNVVVIWRERPMADSEKPGTTR